MATRQVLIALLADLGSDLPAERVGEIHGLSPVSVGALRLLLHLAASNEDLEAREREEERLWR